MTGNGGVSFRGLGFDIRVLANWRSEYKTSSNANAALVQYQKDRIMMNVKTRYSVSKRTTRFLRTFAPKVVFGVEGRL